MLLSSVALSACATKQYGRVQPVTSAEEELYTCREISLELEKIRAFELQIDETGDFDFKTVAGFLGDFGLGNSMAKSDAKASARERRTGLEDLHRQKEC